MIKCYSTLDGLESLDGDVSPDEFKKICSEVNLTFADNNEEIFAINDEVSLRVTIKNVKQLTVKIFEFNTETYYMKNKAVFNTGVNLEGLEASDTLNFEYAQPANVKHEEVFSFP